MVGRKSPSLQEYGKSRLKSGLDVTTGGNCGERGSSKSSRMFVPVDGL